MANSWVTLNTATTAAATNLTVHYTVTYEEIFNQLQKEKQGQWDLQKPIRTENIRYINRPGNSLRKDEAKV